MTYLSQHLLSNSRTLFQKKLLHRGRWIRLALQPGPPKTRNFYSKSFYTFPPKNNFSNETFFLGCLKELNTWLNQIKKFILKNFLYLCKKNYFFKQNQFSHLQWKPNFPPKEIISYNYWKKISYTCAKFLKSFIWDMFWIWLRYFLRYAIKKIHLVLRNDF